MRRRAHRREAPGEQGVDAPDESLRLTHELGCMQRRVGAARSAQLLRGQRDAEYVAKRLVHERDAARFVFDQHAEPEAGDEGAQAFGLEDGGLDHDGCLRQVHPAGILAPNRSARQA